MTNIRLQNPNMDETIKVKEGYKLIRDMLEWLGRGNIDYLQLQQIEPEERIITISPTNGWTESAANKSKIKRLGIELRQEMIDLERKYYV